MIFPLSDILNYDFMKSRTAGMKTNRQNLLIMLIVAVITAGCAANSPCPKTPAIGNAGGLFNTKHDEYSPFIFNDALYYTALGSEKNKDEVIYKSEKKNGSFQVPVPDTSLPMKNFKNSGLPCFYFDEASGKTELYFASISKESKRVNRDIYRSVLIDGSWSDPQPVKPVNSEFYESHPFVSLDGKTLLFTSDREGGIGEIDIYMCNRDNIESQWSAPQNLGPGINTEKNEITPSIAPDASLLYASQGFGSSKTYDIIKAVPNGNEWKNAVPMKFPINTDGDETGPFVDNNMLYLASDRSGGCGKKDLYIFPLCGPVIAKGNIVSNNQKLFEQGYVNLIDAENEVLETAELSEQGEFQFELNPANDYTVQYENKCSKDITASQSFYAPCSDTTVIAIHLKLNIPTVAGEMDLAEVKVPFFVTGYYMPNTRKNLDALRLKFSYNLIGADESGKYIENPGQIYDTYTDDVEKSLNEAADFIFKYISQVGGECSSADMKIKIIVSGYSDPRPISANAKYLDQDINDEEYGIKIAKGDKMDNMLLSKLRAYFTAKHFEKILSANKEFEALSNRLIWQIEGMGVDKSSDTLLEKKRRVNIKMETME